MGAVAAFFRAIAQFFIAISRGLLAFLRGLRKIVFSRKVVTPMVVTAGIIGFAASFYELYDAFGTRITTQFFPDPLPTAPTDRYSIMVADLENDDDRRTLSRAVSDALKLALEETGAEAPVWIDRLPRTIAIGGSGTQAFVEQAEEEARLLLEEVGADILIWGEAVPYVNAYTLRMTAAGSSDFTRYAFEDLRFGAPLLEDLAPLVLGAALAEAGNVDMGEATAAVLGPLVQRLEPLAETPPDVFTGEQIRSLQLAYARVATEFGDIAEGQQQLSEVVSILRETRERTDRGEHPQAWAEVHQALAYALRRLGEKGGKADLVGSTEASRAALQVYTRDTHPVEWALTQQHLGAALYRLHQLGEEGALQQAINAYRAALSVLERERAPDEWASVHNNLGLALAALDPGEGSDALQEAVQSYRAALQVWTRDTAPMDWARVQNNLGIALRELGRRGQEGAFQEAAAAYRAALEVRTREAAPMKWAQVQNNLGNTLWSLGNAGQEGAYEEAVEAFRSALQVWQRDAAPSNWQVLQYNIGGLYKQIGETKADRTALERSVEAFQAYLDFWPRDKNALYWAYGHKKLGETHLAMLEQGAASAYEPALNHFESAAEVMTAEGRPGHWSDIQAGLARAHTLRAQGGESQYLADALAAYEAALGVEEADTVSWAQLQSARSEALLLKAELEDDPASARQAVEILNDAAAVLEEADAPELELARARLARASRLLDARSDDTG
jgi:tetratricopeptide (TPR) repeat protein